MDSLTTVEANIQYKGESWTAYEDLSRLDGGLFFVSQSGKTRNFTRYLEASFDPEPGTGSVDFFLGLDETEVNLALPDLLADALLQNGEPIESHVRDSVYQVTFNNTAFVGNVQANDTMPLDEYGSTANNNPLPHIDPVYLPSDFNFTLSYDGLVGGWMPIIRKSWLLEKGSEDRLELIGFGDSDSDQPYTIKTWFRTTLVINGTIKQQHFSREYEEYLPFRPGPEAGDFYSALLRSGDYWDGHLEDVSSLTLPDQSWADITKHSFAIELLVRYGGVWPKYGFYDRYYAGSEFDGFQDIFTSSVLANLLWGRFDQAKNVIENYFDWFVTNTGDINMRGPEIPQFGLSLTVLATYARYTGDTALLTKYKSKILAWVSILETLHDKSLTLHKTDPNYGLIAGWSESDACLAQYPDLYIAPYWNNNVNAARGLKDLATVSIFSQFSSEWTARAERMINQTATTLESVIQYNVTPPYVPVLPITNGTARECAKLENDTNGDIPCQQKWSHRVYAEMLQPCLLPNDLANLTINSMRAYGITSLGIVANVDVFNPNDRFFLGFISYGYATALLRLDRIDEFVLFLYSHRYHVHSRGQWIAAELSGTYGGAGDSTPFATPAAMTIPILMRLALVLEDPDDEVLYLGRGVPIAWLATGKEIRIQQAPTRWGKVDFSIQLVTQGRKTQLKAVVAFAGDSPPAKLVVKIRLQGNQTIGAVSVNGKTTLAFEENLLLQTKDFGKSISIQGDVK